MNSISKTPSYRRRQHAVHHRRSYRYLIETLAEFIAWSGYHGKASEIKVADVLAWNKKEVEGPCRCGGRE